MENTENIMAIKRKINGQEYLFKLTDQEIYDAYRIKRSEYDREDVKCRLESYIDEDDPDDAEVCVSGTETTAGKLRALLADDEAIDRMAEELRHCLDSHDSISEILWMACDEAIEDELK